MVTVSVADLATPVPVAALCAILVANAVHVFLSCCKCLSGSTRIWASLVPCVVSAGSIYGVLTLVDAIDALAAHAWWIDSAVSEAVGGLGECASGLLDVDTPIGDVEDAATMASSLVAAVQGVAGPAAWATCGTITLLWFVTGVARLNPCFGVGCCVVPPALASGLVGVAFLAAAAWAPVLCSQGREELEASEWFEEFVTGNSSTTEAAITAAINALPDPDGGCLATLTRARTMLKPGAFSVQYSDSNALLCTDIPDSIRWIGAFLSAAACAPLLVDCVMLAVGWLVCVGKTVGV